VDSRPGRPARGGPLPLLLPAALLAVLGAGCPEVPKCGAFADKAAVAQLVSDIYLYPPDLVPDPASYADGQSLLDAYTATARAAGKDRGWSYLTTVQKTEQHYSAGQAAGYGFSLLTRGTQVFVAQVMKGSAAADAGFVRGDELLRIGTSTADLVAVADLLGASPSGVSDALASGAVGVVRVIETRTPAGDVVQRTPTTRVFDLDPVPAWHVSGTTGYLDLRTFIVPAEAPLRAAFAAFRGAGVTDLVVDLRYNGGGLIQTANLLANLLGGGLVSQPMWSQWFNPRNSWRDATSTFQSVPEAAAISRVAFITTGLSASASEIVVNVLDPYVSVALVGATTYGKPVGQLGYQVPGCDTVIYMVAVRFTNSNGHGEYYAGLPENPAVPSFRAPLCPAADDLGHAQDDPAEASHAAALAWLGSGTCPPAPARPVLAARAPMPLHPVPSQVDMPGLH
jgi:carboxyl-terminal processing protease